MFAPTRGLRAFNSAQPLLRSAASRTFSKPTFQHRVQIPRNYAQHYTQPKRWASYYGRPRYQYSRFQQTATLARAWAQRPTFYYEVGGIAVIIGIGYTACLETVPVLEKITLATSTPFADNVIAQVSGRRRFNVVGPDTELATSQEQYKQVMQEFGRKIVPAWDKRAMMVQRVLDRLVPSSGLVDANWEVHVIEDPMKNAFVIPGGKVFVFSGILDVCQGDDGLAAVLGHEIAHNVAHHAAERMSQSIISIAAVNLLILFGIDTSGLSRIILDLAYARPGSRAQESEADYIGLMMMAQSCYNPDAAVGLWARMEKEEQFAPPQFLSTHPSSHNRQDRIREWLPEAHQKAASSDCKSTLDYAHEFRQAFPQVAW